MSTQSGPINSIAFAWALSAVLIVLFVVCLAAAFLLPEWQASHAWIGLFSVAPKMSVRVWAEGFVFSIVFGWMTAIVIGLTYNRLAGR